MYTFTYLVHIEGWRIRDFSFIDSAKNRVNNIKNGKTKLADAEKRQTFLRQIQKT